jgi:predicted enzyme related to lactoylglutathione lyase
MSAGTARPRVRPRPLLAVTDVPRASAWYQAVLSASSGHGGEEYERLVVDGEVVLQLHALEAGHHHGPIGDPAVPRGNGVAVWFEVDDLQASAGRAERHRAIVERPLAVNPNSGLPELWLRDVDGYLVVLSQSPPSP